MCDNPFVLKLYSSMQTDKYVYLVLELLDGGELYHHLQKLVCFAEPMLRFFVSQVVLAFECLHGKDVLYRDDVVAMMNALYATESQTMVEVMVTGLMQALGTGEGPACCISWDRFYECCKEMEDLETILTLVWPKKAGEEQTAAG